MPKIDGHWLLSPSKWHIIRQCPGAPALWLQCPPQPSSKYAAEGTLLHAWAAYYLTGENKPEQDLTVAQAEVVECYVNAVRWEQGERYIEQPVPIGRLTGEEGAEGTPDAYLWFPETKTLEVWDLKTGRGVAVSPIDNAQLLLYTLGILEKHPDWQPEHIFNIIHQPLIDPEPQRWEVPAAALMRFREEVTTRASEAMFGIDGPYEVTPLLHPSESACRFCAAKAICPALKDEIEGMFEYAGEGDYSLAVQEETSLIPLYEPAATARALGLLPLLEHWIKAIREHAESEIRAGRSIPGFKLVEGRKGARRWTSEDDALVKLKGFRLKSDALYSRKLISPTQAEKVLGPTQWKKIQELITQSPGGPVIVPETDKRPAIVQPLLESDFEADDGSDLV